MLKKAINTVCPPPTQQSAFQTRGEKLYNAATSFSRSVTNSPKTPRIAMIKPINMMNDQTTALIDSLNSQLQIALSERDDYKKQIDSIKEGNIDMRTLENFFDSQSPPGISEIGWSLLKEMVQNSFRKPNGHRYSSKTKEIGFILNSKSANTYRTLCFYLPFPSLNATLTTAKSP